MAALTVLCGDEAFQQTFGLGNCVFGFTHTLGHMYCVLRKRPHTSICAQVLAELPHRNPSSCMTSTHRYTADFLLISASDKPIHPCLKQHTHFVNFMGPDQNKEHCSNHPTSRLSRFPQKAEAVRCVRDGFIRIRTRTLVRTGSPPPARPLILKKNLNSSKHQKLRCPRLHVTRQRNPGNWVVLEVHLLFR